jgi:hypothetical protein
MSGVVVRGPNSEYGPPGQTEPLEFTGGSEEQIVEMTYDQAVGHFGKEKADELFKGVTEGGDFSGE